MGQAFVLGLGISGLAAAEFLIAHGYRVSGADRQLPFLHDPYFQKLAALGLTVTYDTVELNWDGIVLMVLSPGISSAHRLCCQAREKGIEVIGEAELALRYLQQPAVAITGTNGKTTVTLLVEHLLSSAGIRARALGNVGSPLTTYLLNPDPSEIIVTELSSFQLETMSSRVFDAAILLNITPDHLDRYAHIDEYARAKCRLQNCLKPGAPFYVHTQTGKKFGNWLKSGYRTYGSPIGSELWTDKVVAKYFENIEYFLPIRYRDLGAHECENALAAWALCRQFPISKEQFCQGLETFKKPPHRLELVEVIDGVSFFDDSKGTNIDAVVRAVQAMKGPVVLIVGGVDKGAAYLPWKEHFEGKVKRIIAIGQAAPKIYRELSPYFDIELVESLGKAVEIGMRSAALGDSVLLSPGCSSYDMFRDYAHRGEEFQRSVRSLRGGE